MYVIYVPRTNLPIANSSGALKRRGLIRLQEYSFALMNNQHTGNLYVSFLTRKSPWDLSVIPGDLLINYCLSSSSALRLSTMSASSCRTSSGTSCSVDSHSQYGWISLGGKKALIFCINPMITTTSNYRICRCHNATICQTGI